jgi:glyoxylase-like metal-dependent hydrolase (beta-lactamase superfamily II)
VNEVAPGVWLVPDTCNVYLVEGTDGRALAIDFGSGRVLDAAAERGLRITDVLMTHHHRDQGQGLPRAVEAGIAIHVPPVEVDLFAKVDEMWATRQLDNDYNLRQDRFSLLEPVPVASTMPEYRTASYAGVDVHVLPTPGHTTGSDTYLIEREGRRLAFTGDLIYAPGKVWSLAASQWSYTHHEGPAMTVLSCILLADESPAMLLPSHGEPMPDGVAALDRLREVMQRYVDSRREQPWDLEERLRSPWVRLTDHLLRNRSSTAYGYAVLSDTGEALLIDYGYDMTTGLPSGGDRASRRPWLASIPALKSQFGVTKVAAVIPTHYHDDHVAGMPLLREVEGTQLWVPENVAPILADPLRYDLPCQWYDPIVADRILPLGEFFQFHEHTITVHDQPGHTLYAAAFELAIDGVRVLFTGDQLVTNGVRGERREILNYQYRNLFRTGDYVRSGELYQRVGPGLLASGHWEPRWVDEHYLADVAEEGRFVADIHDELLPLEEWDMPADSILVRIAPYRTRLQAPGTVHLTATVRNPGREAAETVVNPVVPVGWRATPGSRSATIGAGDELGFDFEVQVVDFTSGRSQVAVDVTIGGVLLGQAAEAIVEVRP